jgi:hypothetical protein
MFFQIPLRHAVLDFSADFTPTTARTTTFFQQLYGHLLLYHMTCNYTKAGKKFSRIVSHSIRPHFLTYPTLPLLMARFFFQRQR